MAEEIEGDHTSPPPTPMTANRERTSRPGEGDFRALPRRKTATITRIAPTRDIIAGSLNLSYSLPEMGFTIPRAAGKGDTQIPATRGENPATDWK